MSESHKYYYMKLKETFFNDSKILLLEQMQDGPLYILLLLKFYLISFTLSIRTYYSRREEALSILSSVLWGYTSVKCNDILDLFMVD